MDEGRKSGVCTVPSSEPLVPLNNMHIYPIIYIV